ncbi:MAG: P1 family peptidase [Candidatus Hodarchaeales archaeon]|jgi:L-aminopeptidase/D-esterase-like protein
MNNQIITNDLVDLKPKTSYRDPVLKFDFPGLRIGIGEYEEGPTGCTVFHFLKRNTAVADIRGGDPIALNYTKTIPWLDALCFTGGSILGVESLTGVTAELLKMKNYKRDKYGFTPIVNGAVIYDWHVRKNVIYPDKTLGREAVKSARENIFPMGNQGAGRSATVGKWINGGMREPGGQGGAFLEIDDAKILFFIVTNSLGVLKNKKGEIVRGNLDRETNKRYEGYEYLQKIGNEKKIKQTKGNTTLSLLFTNLEIENHMMIRIAKQVHSSLARAIDPFHTWDDGDALFFVSTNEIKNKDLQYPTTFGTIASEVAWDAVLNSFETNKKIA